MDRLLECVPNISEGRDPDTLTAVASAIDGVAGARLLDRTADRDHNRSVYTFAGDRASVPEAMEQAMAAAIENIDMRGQTGQHPRIGAVDVVPFVPLGGSTIDDAVETARSFAAVVADRFELPIYLYGAAATRADRRVLADVRRPRFEGLAAALASTAGAPDFGPPRPHPTAGATAVGARPFLIAWNVQLRTADVGIARRLAAGIRERDGGLPAVQALGLELAALDCVQLSMNLLDHDRTPLWLVWETANRLASAEEVAIIDSELIGLVPAAALDAVADHIGERGDRIASARHSVAAGWLRIRDFEPSMTIEARLAERRG